MSVYDKYEAVIGLEVHAQLNTKTKIFASDSTTFGAEPNTQVGTITLGMPGVLPKLNKAVLEKAIKIGIACGSNITKINEFARKNYYYADLPKGYQITQDKTPICVGGTVDIEVNGTKKAIELTRVHMEEDAGKNNHELDPFYSLVDLNRAGTPLIEIVSEPCITSSDEAYAYLTEVRKLVRYLDICDGNMEEGSMRCDANISIRLKGEKILNTRVEVKNMNSIRNVKRAIDNEIIRQVDIVETGGTVDQETRSFVAIDGSSFVLRSKEFAHDYRYFPEPDLPPAVVTEAQIETIKANMPPLPKQLYLQFTNEFGLSDYDSTVLTDEKDTALYFLDLTNKTKNYKSAANWIMGEVKSYLNDKGLSIIEFPVQTDKIAALIALTDENLINSSAAKTIFQHLLDQPEQTPKALAEQLNLIQSSNADELEQWIDTVLNQLPEKVEEYKKGKKGLIGLFMGEVMKVSKGKADPKLTNQILGKKLNN